MLKLKRESLVKGQQLFSTNRLRNSRSFSMPGRCTAICISPPGCPTTWIVNIYLPSPGKPVYGSVVATLIQHMKSIDTNEFIVMIGDFNAVPCPEIDRKHTYTNGKVSPQKPSAENSFLRSIQINSLGLNLQDAWRVLHRDEIAFTHNQPTASGLSESRIDLSYISSNLVENLIHSWIYRISFDLRLDHHQIGIAIVLPVPLLTTPTRQKDQNFCSINTKKTSEEHIKRYNLSLSSDSDWLSLQDLVSKASIPSDLDPIASLVYNTLRKTSRSCLPMLPNLTARKQKVKPDPHVDC